MARTDHHIHSTPDPWRVNTQRPERQARPAGRIAALAEAELCDEFGGAEPFDLVFVPVEDEPACEEWEPDPFCSVCGRVTDHVAEHDDVLYLGVRYFDGGRVACSWDVRYVIQHGMVRV